MYFLYHKCFKSLSCFIISFSSRGKKILAINKYIINDLLGFFLLYSLPILPCHTSQGFLISSVYWFSWLLAIEQCQVSMGKYCCKFESNSEFCFCFLTAVTSQVTLGVSTGIFVLSPGIVGSGRWGREFPLAWFLYFFCCGTNLLFMILY